MNITKSNKLAIILIIIGIVFFVLMFFNPISEIALAIAGLAFILSGFIQLGHTHDSEQNKKQFENLMTKLNELQQALEKVEQPRGTGVAIADVISSGLKYYAEHMAKPEKEEKK